MGRYLNPAGDKFARAVRSEIYVDKSELIRYTNQVLGTEDCYMCVSRPRRFGKSMAANMLTAYYSRGCKAGDLFRGLKIEKDESFAQHMNHYHVIFINMLEFLALCEDEHVFFERLQNALLKELREEAVSSDRSGEPICFDSLRDELHRIYSVTGIPFVFIVDEWDCIFRERKEEEGFQRAYLDFMRNILKDQPYVGLVYMTGILPIKKYGTHSALNMFEEFSMFGAGDLSEFMAFTEEEVMNLCKEYCMDYLEMKEWYDGYSIQEDCSLYGPRSVVSALRRREFDNYWNQTETFEALKLYLEMNFDGLRDAVIAMVSGSSCRVRPQHFSNDMLHFASSDDVLTLLVHLGYLTYNARTKKARIPNKEIAAEFSTAIQSADWDIVGEALKNSQELLEAIWHRDEKKIAASIEKAHLETSHLQYNDENALSYTVSLALFAARNYYSVIRELPSGRGFADMAFIPRRKYVDKPAFLIELKWDKSANGALCQIEEKQYTGVLSKYGGDILLIGINYDKKTRTHTCKIRSYVKG